MGLLSDKHPPHNTVHSKMMIYSYPSQIPTPGAQSGIEPGTILLQSRTLLLKEEEGMRDHLWVTDPDRFFPPPDRTNNKKLL
jgi:hypothetical protein